MLSAAAGVVVVVGVTILVIVAIGRQRLGISGYQDYKDPFGE